jgi:hypothetical protein
LQAVASSSIAVTPAAPSILAFGQQPTAGSIGVILGPAVTVRVEDVYGNLTSSTAPVTLALACHPALSVLHGTLTRPAVGGVATFGNLWLSFFGRSFTLKATSPGLTLASSAPFSISTGIAAQLVLTAPGHATVGVPFQVTVTVKDVFGNVVPTFTGTIRISTGGALPPVAYTFTTGDRGSHTYTLAPARKGTLNLSVQGVSQVFPMVNWAVLVA